MRGGEAWGKSVSIRESSRGGQLPVQVGAAVHDTRGPMRLPSAIAIILFAFATGASAAPLAYASNEGVNRP